VRTLRCRRTAHHRRAHGPSPPTVSPPRVPPNASRRCYPLIIKAMSIFAFPFSLQALTKALRRTTPLPPHLFSLYYADAIVPQALSKRPLVCAPSNLTALSHLKPASCQGAHRCRSTPSTLAVRVPLSTRALGRCPPPSAPPRASPRPEAPLSPLRFPPAPLLWPTTGMHLRPNRTTMEGPHPVSPFPHKPQIGFSTSLSRSNPRPSHLITGHCWNRVPPLPMRDGPAPPCSSILVGCQPVLAGPAKGNSTLSYFPLSLFESNSNNSNILKFVGILIEPRIMSNHF
jgi:hypothetical protein